jgi:hypothetical protein
MKKEKRTESVGEISFVTLYRLVLVITHNLGVLWGVPPLHPDPLANEVYHSPVSQPALGIIQAELDFATPLPGFLPSLNRK